MNPSKVVAAIIKKNNLYLIVQRNKNKHLGLKWEFPGGKVQSGETLTKALIREIKEELNIVITVHKKIAVEKYKDHKINIVLNYFLCAHQKGIMVLSEHENFAWVEQKNLKKYDFAEGDGNILSLL